MAKYSFDLVGGTMMAEHSQSAAFNKKDMVDIMLKEHAVLWAEKAARLNHRFGLIGIAGGSVVFMATQASTLQGWLCGAFAIVMLLVLWWRYGALIKKLAERISDIEVRVNELAGEELIAWESRIAKSLVFHRFYRSSTNTPSKKPSA